MTDNFEVCVCSNDILFSGNSNSMAKEMNSINKNNTHLAWVFRYFQRDILPDLPSCCHSKDRILLQRKRASSILILPKKWFSFFVFASFNLNMQSDQNILKIKMWKQSLENICICRFDKNKSNISGKWKISISCNRCGAKCLPSKH